MNEPAGIPKKFKDATLKSFGFSDDSRIPKLYGYTCRSFALGEYEQNCLLLCGNVGNGKTHLAVSALKIASREKSKRTLFMVADELLANLNFASQNQHNKIDLIKHYLFDYDMLCIDGLEKEKFTDAAKENIFLIINKAYYEIRPLIITTNLSLDTFKDIDERIYSRLHEMSIILPFAWNDYRINR